MSEISKAAARGALAGSLLAAWCVYALTVKAGAGVAALQAAMRKKGPPPKSTTAVSWENGGKPLDAKAIEDVVRRANEAKAASDAAVRAAEAEGAPPKP